MSLPSFNFRSFTVTDIRECLENSGYITTDSEWEFADDAEAFKYIGYSDGNHRFLVGLVNDQSTDESDTFMATRLYFNLNHDGKLCADYGGTVEKEGTYEEITTYIDVTCN